MAIKQHKAPKPLHVPLAWLITLTMTLIILDITKTSSNDFSFVSNCTAMIECQVHYSTTCSCIRDRTLNRLMILEITTKE